MQNLMNFAACAQVCMGLASEEHPKPIKLEIQVKDQEGLENSRKLALQRLFQHNKATAARAAAAFDQFLPEEKFRRVFVEPSELPCYAVNQSRHAENSARFESFLQHHYRVCD